MDFSDILPSDVQWWDLLIALLISIAGWVLSRFVRKGVRALLHRTPGISETLAHVVSRICGYAVILLGIGIGLAVLGANVQPLLAVVLIVAVVLALVLRGVADNFAAGVLIQTRQPVKVGDEIRIDGPDGLITGTVTELNSRSVVLLTVDGRTVHVPNAMILSDPIINDSTNGARRSEVQVRAGRAGASIDDVLTRIASATADVPGVHSREHVRTLVIAVSPDRLTVLVQFWHHPLQGVPVTADVVRSLAETLEASGVTVTVTSDPGAAPLVPPEPV